MPRVPSAPMNKSTRSIPRASGYPEEHFGTSGRWRGVTGTRCAPREVRMSKYPSPCAQTSPRRTSRTSPLARTAVRPSTQSRVVPYLNVAGPAAFVDVTPPTHAPAYVGTGGYSRSCGASACSSASMVTPGPASTSLPRMVMVARRELETTNSPRGVAPPVSEDCAPMTSTGAPRARAAATSASVSGWTRPDAKPPGKWAASSLYRRQDVPIGDDAHRAPLTTRRPRTHEV